MGRARPIQVADKPSYAQAAPTAAERVRRLGVRFSGAATIGSTVILGAEATCGSRVDLSRALLIFPDAPGDAAAYFFTTSNPFA